MVMVTVMISFKTASRVVRRFITLIIARTFPRNGEGVIAGNSVRRQL